MKKYFVTCREALESKLLLQVCISKKAKYKTIHMDISFICMCIFISMVLHLTTV